MDNFEKIRIALAEKLAKKRGIAMFSAIFVMIIIGLLAMQFHFMSRQAQSTAFRFQASEIARQLAESAIDEAFLFIHNKSEKPGDEFFDKILPRSGKINCSTTSMNNLAGKGVPVKVDMTIAAAAAIPNGEKFDIKALARIVDFRDTDSEGGKYYDKEGVGTLEIKVSVTPKDSFKKQIQSACHITRQHDYKVVSIVSKRNNNSQRNEYVQNYVLDYALFVKNGQEEFNETSGLSLNSPDRSFSINQSSLTANNCGKVFLGNSPGNHVYLNLDPDRKDFIPAPQEKKQIIAANDTQVFQLLPTFHDTVKAEVNRAVRNEGAKLKSFSMYGHKAYFQYARYPITNDALSSMNNLEEYRDVTVAAKAKFTSSKAALEYPGGLFVEPESMLKDIIEGDVRQRFFHFGYFIVDLTNGKIRIKAQKGSGITKKKKTIVINFPPQTVNDMLKERYPCFDADHLAGLPNANATLNLRYLKDTFALSQPEILCEINEKNLYQKGSNTPFPTPRFYHYRDPGSSDSSLYASVPYAHVNLWTRRKLSLQQAEDFGILSADRKKVNLRGIVQINEPVTLGTTGGTVEVSGRGVLIAPGITIKSGIEKADGDAICVLLTRGYPIVVDTDQPINASLVSIGLNNRNGHIKALKKLDLRGALAVDLLRLDQWAAGVEHAIKYDPALKANKDIYQINLSRWVSFQRMIEQDDDA